MDYNDNDYEGHNIHLAGEESSKVSSSSRPFTLPKFDFDDGLHGHLRFDSLVENEVFLGIPSQDDNQWIEDYSKGSTEVGFSSSVTEPCVLPRCNNVWSEATLSESVEMLLNAVGQEEMVPGESMVEESDPGDQIGSLTEQIETDLRQHDETEEMHGVNTLLPPAEVEESDSKLNQSTRIESDTAYTLQAQEEKNYHGMCVDDKETNSMVACANSNSDPKISDNLGKIHELVNDSLCNQVRENYPVPGMGIDHSENFSHNDILESNDQDKISHISFVSPSCMLKGITKKVEEKPGLNASNDGSCENASETVNQEMHYSLDIPSEMEFQKEELAVEIRGTDSEATSSVPEKGESLTTVRECSEVAIFVETLDGSECETAVFSSSSEIKQPSGAYSMLHDTLSVSSHGEGCTEKFGINDSADVIPTICESELKQVVTQPLDQPMSPVVSEDICPQKNHSPGASHATFEASILSVVVSNPSKQDSKIYIDHADGTSNIMDSSFGGGCSVEKSVIEIGDARSDAMSQKENSEDVNHLSAPILTGGTQKCVEDILSVQEDVRIGDQDVSLCEEDSKKLPLDLSNIVSDKNVKEAGSDYSSEGGEINVETAAGSQPKSSVGDIQVLNIEDEDSRPRLSHVDHDKLVDCRGHKSPSSDMGFINQIEEIEVTEEPNTSTSKESLEEVAKVAPSIDIENSTLPISVAAGETKLGDQSVCLVDTCNATMPGEGPTGLNENIEHPVSDLMVKNDVSEASPTEKPIEAETEKSRTNSSMVSGSSSVVDIDEPFQPFTPSSNNNLPEDEINKEDSLKSTNTDCVGEDMSKHTISRKTALFNVEETFTFDIRPLGGQSTVDSDKELESFPKIKPGVLSLTEKASFSTPGSGQRDLEISHGSSLTPSVVSLPFERVKGTSERKTRHGSSKSGKASVKKENLVKDTTSSRKTGRGNKLSMSLSPLGGGAGQVITFETPVKSRGVIPIATSSLPDLNTSTPSSSFFQQPFTDLQQVQLRAQIFVYGSLIQGAAPDEACMVSAFGISDGGRSIWEASWKTCVERSHGLKNQGNNAETPLQSLSGAKAPDQSSRKGSSQSEVLSTPVGRSSNNSILSPVINPIIPLSSPLWNISTPSFDGLPSSNMARNAVYDYRAVSPLPPYQVPPVRNFIARTTSWLPQAPFPVPWLTSSQSSPFNTNAKYSAFPNTEPVKLTPVKELSFQISSGVKHASPIPAIHTAATTVFAGTSPLLDSKIMKGSNSQISVDTKTRKRKKSSAVKDVVYIPPTVSPVESFPATMVATDLPKKVATVEDLNLTARTQDGLTSTPIISYHYSTPSVAVPSQSSFTLEGTSNQSCGHLQRGDLILDKKAPNLEAFSKVEEAKLQAEVAAADATVAVGQCEGVWRKLVEQKNSSLTSDAEAILASAAVAIAGAASVAKAAAAAAKVAASVAVQAKQMADEAIIKHGTSVSNLRIETPVKCPERNNASTLAISAARETSRKRVKAASAAARHAENLDAIVKAAELAAEAVSHTGKIVGMGDPFSLRELEEAGPDSYWKVSQMDQNMSDDNVVAGAIPNVIKNLDEISKKDGYATGDATPPIQRDVSGNIIKEGSLVEVLRDFGNSKKAWFSAKILSLKDGEALVCYTELQSDEGSEQLKEQVSLEAQDSNAPIMRIPHPMTSVQFEGTRKRRRAATKDYAWSVGDRVDAWVKDCWREGIIADKNTKDPTALNVNFPADAETIIVKVWHLRPTVIWSEGQWIECSRTEEDGTSKGDTPAEKRPKLGSTGIESKGKAKLAENTASVEVDKTKEPKLPISATDNVFNVGSTKDDNNPNTGRTVRSGLQKEGPRVVFGVPKPGKKRKFMDVSKHYISEKNIKITAPNDSAKLSKILTPQVSGSSRGFKNNSKPDFKEKQSTEIKARPIRSVKPPVVPNRTLPRKVDPNSSRPSSMSNDDDESGPSNVEVTSGGTMVFSSKALPPESLKKALTRNVKKPEQLNKGKFMPSRGKFIKTESNEKSTSDGNEPRRSIRRIQPTSRLLEGLQSSLMIPKFPSHDKGQRSSHSRGSSRGSE